MRARNQTGAALGQFRKDIDRSTASARNFRAAIGAAVGAVGLVQVARAAVDAADSITLLQSKIRLVTRSDEELARVQAKLVRLADETRSDLTSTAELYARVARNSKQLGASQSELLNFTKAVTQAIQISGNTAVEASAGVIQLGQALASGTLRGDELRSVLEQMPRVASAIADGLHVTIGELRSLGAEGRLTSKEVFAALLSQSGRLREEFAKLTPTIGGQLQVVKNDLALATAEMLKTTHATQGLTASLSGLAGVIRASGTAWNAITLPLRTVQDIFGGISDRLAEIRASLPKLEPFFVAMGSLTQMGARAELIDILENRNAFTRGGGPRRGGARNRGEEEKRVSQLKEITVRARQIQLNADQEYFAQLQQLTRTSSESAISTYREQRAAIDTLLRESQISVEQATARIREAQDTLLPEIDIAAIRELYIPLEQTTSETAEIMKGIWQGVGQSLQRSLSDAFYNAKLDVRSLVDVARRAFADMASALLTSGLQKQLAGLFGFLGGNTGSGSTAGLTVDAGFAVFGTKAGGGRFDGPTIVGEDGPEIVTGRGRVFNRRQLAFAGGAGGVSFKGGDVTVNLIERDNPNETKQEIFQAVALENAKQQREFIRLLGRSGVEVKG